MGCWKKYTQVVVAVFLLVISLPISGAAKKDSSFPGWLQSFYPIAAKQGISRSIYEQAFSGVTTSDNEVLRKAAYQPEFTTEIWDYIDTGVNSVTVEQGRVMAEKYRQLLNTLEARFGVESSVLLAIWSMESGYGAVLQRPSRLHYVPRALATLAHADTSLRKFAQKQLIAALKIVQNGDVSFEQLYGSWAGAMGHTQFIPTSYLAYGVDMDKDGRRDIWNSIPDALGTAANLLSKNGWRPGTAWGYEVRVPAQGIRYAGKTKTLKQWQRLGFIRPGGKAFREIDARAELKIFAGASGPGFLMLRNFFILKRYNNSDFYALAVSLLSDRLAGKQGMTQAWPRKPGDLFLEEKFELQELLRQKGFYDGDLDGNLGTKTKEGIKAFQGRVGLVPEGKPTREVLQALRRL